MNPPWKITGYDSATAIYEGEAPSTLTEDEIATMLQRLAARHLSPGEVVAASLRKNLKGYAPCHIDRAGKKGNSVWTGGNPHYIAFRKRVV